MGEYRVVVAHPYKQHSFEMAEGLRRKNLLYKYITTVYYKRFNLTGICSLFLKGQSKEKALGRQDDRIDSYVIQFCEGEGLLKLLSMKTPFLNKYYERIKYHSSDRFAKKVAKYCIHNNVDAVVIYDDTSPICAETLQKMAPNIKVIMDMSAPAIPYLSSIYEDDMRKNPAYASKLRSEVKKALDAKMIKRAQREIDAADYFIAASEFTKLSLIESGVEESRISICRYGINQDLFSPGENRDSERLRAVYIGGTKQYKGISYLLEAFSQLKDYPIELIVVGVNDLYDNESVPNVVFTGVIMHHEVAEILKTCDFSIFPSLGDGFGFAVSEALSAGCPVICSKNAGASDLIKDNVNGFIVNAQNSQEIVEKVLYFYNNRNALNRMRNNAIKSVKQLTWENYYCEVSSTIYKRLTESKD